MATRGPWHQTFGSLQALNHAPASPIISARRSAGARLASTVPVALSFGDGAQLRPVGRRLEFGQLGGTLESGPGDQPKHGGVLDDVVEEASNIPRDIVCVERHRVHQGGAAVGERGVEETVLASEVGVDELLVGLGRVSDPVDARSRDSVRRELVGGGLEQPLLRGGRVADG